MTAAPAYHSALHPPRLGRPCTRVVSPHGVAFTWDVFSGTLPPEYDACDVLYADLPWRAGFSEFERRAGRLEGRRYGDFLAAVNRITARLPGPAVYVTGRHALPMLAPPTAVRDTRLNGAPAVAVVYGRVDLPDWSDATGILSGLCRQYRCIGDFCCGTGRTVAMALAAGKRFVASDHNAACIGAIREDLLEAQRP